MADHEIKGLILEHLEDSERETALAFAEFLLPRVTCLYRDQGFWKNKIYYIADYQGEGVCYIAIRDPDEPENRWTVWSDDMDCSAAVDREMAEAAWTHVDHCGHCGSCGGGRHKVIFGKEFADVCGCTFRLDNPGLKELSFLRKMVELRIHEIDSGRKEME